MDELCYRCLRYATLPYVEDCPHLEDLGERRAATVKECKEGFLSKLNVV